MTPCQKMALEALHSHIDHYHGSLALTDKDTIHLERYRGKSGFFLKKPIITDKMNLNRWQVTWEAIKQDIWGFIGKPVVLTPDLDHPPVSEQEDYRVGNIIDIQLDEVNKIAYQISEIFDEKAQQMILDGKVKFGSPTVLIYSEATRQQRFKGTEYQEDILHRFRPAHDALVEDPAYGKHVDYIPAVCTGDGVGCGLKLLSVSASVEYRSRYEGAANPQAYDPQEVGYVESSTPKQCQTCIKFQKPNICHLPLSKPVEGINGCCNNWKENKEYSSEIVNSDNTDQLTIVPFVKSKLNKRFSSEELANIIGNIKNTKEADSDSCVSRKIRIISDEHPTMEHDQVIAIAYSYCQKEGDELEAVFMPKLADELMKYYKT